MPHSNPEALARIVSLLHETVHDDSIWPAALEAIRQYFHSADACFVLQAMDGYSSDVICVGGDPEFARVYVEADVQRDNPFNRVLAMRGLGGVFTDDQPVPREELRASTFFNEWMAPQDRETMIGTKVLERPDQAGFIALQRPPWLAEFGDEELRAMRFLAPIMTRVVALGQRFQASPMPHGMARGTLDALDLGVMTLDTEARVIEANQAAEALLADPGTGLSRGVLGSLRTAPAQLLTLRRLLAEATAPGLAARAGHLLLPPVLPEAPRLLAAILPPTPGDMQEGTALVFLRSLDGPAASPSPAATLFALTEAEGRVAAALTRGLSLAEIAQAQGVSLNTIRTHLARLFDKTGVSRQGQLVALLKQVELPIRVSRRSEPGAVPA